MKVPCGQCPAKYAILDERIRGKKVRIHCKRCGAAIVVDGKTDPPLVTTEGVPGARAHESEPPSNPRPEAKTIMGGLEAPLHLREPRKRRSSPPPRPMRTLHPASDPAAMGLAAAVPVRPGMPAATRGFTEPPLAQENGPPSWRVAMTENELRWMTTSEVLGAYQAGVLKPETFVLRRGMPQWQTLLEVPELADALARAEGPTEANGLSSPELGSDAEVTNGSAHAAPAPAPRRASSSKRQAVFASSRAEPAGSGLDAEDAALAGGDDDPEPFALHAVRSPARPKHLDESFLTLPFTDAEVADSTPSVSVPDVAPPIQEPPEQALLAAPAQAAASPGLADEQTPLASAPAVAQRAASAFENELRAIPPQVRRPPPASPLWPWLLAAIVLLLLGAFLLSRTR